MPPLLCLFGPSVLACDSEETSDLMINSSKGKILKITFIKKYLFCTSKYNVIPFY